FDELLSEVRDVAAPEHKLPNRSENNTTSGRVPVNGVTVHKGTTRQHWILLRRILRQLNWRTSTGARQATAAMRPHVSASSRPAAPSTKNPPMYSLVSTYGPSVTSTLPAGCARSHLALLAEERPPTKILTPTAFISSLSTSISWDIASSSVDGS